MSESRGIIGRAVSFWEALASFVLSLFRRSGTVPGKPEPQPLKQWTFLAYIAGDNSLEEAGRKDLLEMKAAGSTDQVNIVAQFDNMRDRVTRRYYIRQGGTLEQDLVASLPEINTGDPEALADFLAWAFELYPAQHYALVLWNHGSGWKDEDIYKELALAGFNPSALTRGQRRSLSSGNVSRAVFRSTVQAVAQEALEAGRAILFDDTSADFLDNVEMKAVLDEATKQLGRKLDLLGCDACLMSMIEVAYQLRDSCRYLVASQEEEPGDGWPYDAILNRLIAQPEMPPSLLATVIVEEYCRFYRLRYPNLPVTQSALDLERLEVLASAMDDLADALRNEIQARPAEGNALLSLALYDVQRFADRDYIDLADFCRLLFQQNPAPPIREAAARILALLSRGNPSSPIVAEGHAGPGMRHVSGISVYFPERSLSPLYSRLEFSKDHRWDDLLEAIASSRYRVLR